MIQGDLFPRGSRQDRVPAPLDDSLRNTAAIEAVFKWPALRFVEPVFVSDCSPQLRSWEVMSNSERPG